MIKQRLIEFIATFAFVGKVKYAPGTFGSLAAFPFMYLLLTALLGSGFVGYLSDLLDSEEMVVIFFAFALLNIVLFVIGTIASSHYIKLHPESNDPKEVVIDEVAGQMLTSLLCFFGSMIIAKSQLAQKIDIGILNFIFVFILPFTLFRIFDIFKPWPISYIDQNIKGGLGIMLDDILAAIFAFVVFYTIIFNILNFFPII
jgi:phosphatidylglycerophosphatase A